MICVALHILTSDIVGAGASAPTPIVKVIDATKEIHIVGRTGVPIGEAFRAKRRFEERADGQVSVVYAVNGREIERPIEFSNEKSYAR